MNLERETTEKTEKEPIRSCSLLFQFSIRRPKNSSDFWTTDIAKPSPHGIMVCETCLTSSCRAGGVSPKFWRNLGFRRRKLVFSKR